MAYHGKLLHIPVVVVTPETAPIMKVSRCLEYGAKVELHGKNLEEAKQYAHKLAEEQNLQYINGWVELSYELAKPFLSEVYHIPKKAVLCIVI